MKVQVRQGVFETNSSSTHSMTVSKTSDYEAFKNGKMWAMLTYSSDDDIILLPEAEAIEYNIKQLKDRNCDEGFINTYREKKNFWEAFSSKYSEDDETQYDDWESFKDEYELDSCSEYYMSWEDFWDGECMQTYEQFSRNIVSEHGDKITVWGYYGNDY